MTTTTTTAAILETLTAAFADIDAAHLAKEIEWARGRKVALDAVYASVDRNDRSVSFHDLISAVCDTTWYNVLVGATDAKIVAFCTKNNAKRAEKRTAKIAKDLEKVGIVSVESAEVVVNNGGFDGVYRVTTEKGVKTVRINTIYAGGYNIQCLHTRVLVSVK